MISVAVFVFGLLVGSFLNAIIYRLERGESAFQGRSYCPHCKHQLSWQDLIPLLSFVSLQGKCRYCRKQISFQYPLVELATGLLFVAAFSLFVDNLTKFSFPQALNLLYLWAIASLLIVIFVYDLKHYLIPDKVLYPAIGLAAVWRAFEFLDFDILNLFGIWDLGLGISPPLLQAVLSGLGAAAFFFAIFLVSKGGAMGFGDVKLALFMGLFLGWPNILVALFLAFFIGAVIGIALILLKRKTLQSQVPFGPFLVIGTFLSLFWGERIIDWYFLFFLVQ